MSKLFTLFSDKDVHIAPGEKIIPAKEFSTLCKATDLLKKVRAEALDFASALELVRTRATKGGMDARILWTLQQEAAVVRMLTRDPILGQMGCINVDQLQRMVGAARQGESRNTVYLFSVLSLETWLRVRFGVWQSLHAKQSAA